MKLELEKRTADRLCRCVEGASVPTKEVVSAEVRDKHFHLSAACLATPSTIPLFCRCYDHLHALGAASVSLSVPEPEVLSSRLGANRTPSGYLVQTRGPRRRALLGAVLTSWQTSRWARATCLKVRAEVVAQ